MERPGLVTTIAIAICAYAACDIAHEVLGHGLATALAPQVQAVTLSTVALSTQGSSPWVAAAGPVANMALGALGFLALRRHRSFSHGAYFLWLFSALNLLDGTGYLIYSGVLGSGDRAVALAGLHPQAMGRVGMVVVGALAYAGSVAVAAAGVLPWVRNGSLPRGDLPWHVTPVYLAGGMLFLAGALLNPLRDLILLSGVASGFGAMAGLLLVPWIVERQTPPTAASERPGRRHLGWILAGALVAALFIGVLGPGIQV